MATCGSALVLHEGYRAGAVAEIIKLHMDFYADAWGFGAPFEALLAADLGCFIAGYQPTRDFLVCVDDARTGLAASIAVSGRHSFPDAARIRWFIVADAVRGQGIGRDLLTQALGFCRENGFRSAWLTTFEGLDAAKTLYLDAGFRMTGVSDEDEWSGGVREQRYEIDLAP